MASYYKKFQSGFLSNPEDGFKSVKLSIYYGNKAMVTIDDGNGNISIAQNVIYKDATKNVHFYLQTDGDIWVLMLPNEY